MKKNMRQFRQGDVLLERIEERPAVATNRLPAENGRVILAHGEATGHAHSVAGSSGVLYQGETTSVTYLEVEAALAMLTHEEHGVIRLPAGTYRVRRQREYSPEAIRNVAD